MARQLLPLAMAAMCAVIACSEDQGPSGRVTIDVSPLSLDGIAGATYTVTVANTTGPVWTRTLSSAQYGDGQGALTYVGPCDATAGATEHTVSLELVELRDSTRALVDGVDFVNPAPVGDPIVALATCRENADSPVVFDLVVARSAEQGFFDVAVEFDDIFCSAKLDCEASPGVPLELLFDTTGTRAMTAVVGFTCTAGPGTATWLWMDRLAITCEGGGPFIVDVADGPGNLDPVFDEPSMDLLFQAAVYRGVGLEGGADTAYWNVALGLNEEAFDTLGDCVLTGMATATEGPLTDGVTPPGVRYPIVTWNVPLLDDGDRVCTTHGLDGGDEVKTGYSPVTGHGFYAGFDQASGLVTVTGATPDATSTLACAASELEVGQSTNCVLTARQANNVIGTASGNFQLAANAGQVSALSPAYGTTFTFTYTATVSGVVVIDAGVGPTAAITVVDEPDAALIACADSELEAGGTTTCTVTPRKGGATITARAIDVPVSASAGTVSALSPATGTTFTFTLTAPAITGPLTVSALGTDTILTVYATPDAASISCITSELAVSNITTCTLTPTRSGAPVVARANDILVTASAGSISALAPSIGTSFTFSFTAPPTTGVVTLSAYATSTNLTIYDTADGALLSCEDTVVPVNGTTNCVMTPTKFGAPVAVRAADVQVSASAGTVSALSPSFGTSFEFTYTAPAGSGVFAVASFGAIVSMSVYDSPDSATLTCADTVLAAGATTTCIVTPMKGGALMTARAEDVVVTASAGSVAALTPSIGSSFSFSYTAPSTTGSVTLSSLGADTGLTIYGTPDAATIVCGATTLPVGGTTSCMVTPTTAGQPITARAVDVVVTTSAGSVSSLSPSIGTSFTFSYTAPATSGAVTVSSLGANTALTIYDTPDAATIVCGATTLPVGGTTSCTVSPTRAGQPITARAMDVVVTTSTGSVSSLSPSIGTSFTFSYTAPSTTGSVTVSSLGSNAALTIYDTPDAATILCGATTLSVGGTTTCTVTPKKAGLTITARAVDVVVTTSAGSVSSLSPTIGTSFGFTFTAPSTSQIVSLTGLFGTLPLTITDIPDGTSGVSCVPSSVTTTTTSTCTITARRAGAAIYTSHNSFFPSTSAGTVSGLSPTSIATTFTFTLTAPATAQTLTVGSGITTTSVTVTATCNDGVQNGTETAIDCGGSCGACAVGQACSTANDCGSRFCSTGTCAWATSCLQLMPQNPTSGEYTIDPDGAAAGGTYPVYCDMATAGGGWTVFRNADVGLVPGVNQAWRTDKARVVSYLRDSSGNRYTTVLEQLSQYAGTNLELVTNGDGYQVQFVPGVVQNTINGFRTNGSDQSFVNCDGNANSYFQFYRSGLAGPAGSEYDIVQAWRNSKVTFTPNMATTFFGNVTVAFGGCGAWTHNANFTDTITSVALGLR